MLNQKNKYMPDVLDCIANLSNDEVFTSPKLANQMLDMVPQELFASPDTKFLDPACKSGVFLREIVKRLDKGLEHVIPDKQERIDHILHKQVFGIAITELTSQLSRRTLYCSKYACAIDEDADESLWEDEKNNVHIAHPYSISTFTEADVNDFCINPIQGNIRFNKKIKHDFDKDGTCKVCGANKNNFEEASHAYEFIHLDDKRLEILKAMQWDLIISNPPYQLSTGGSKSQAIPLYNRFVEQAIKLNPRYLSMIIPDRWFSGGFGLSSFRKLMLNEKRIRVLYDYTVASDAFPGVDIPGGVCYFLWDKRYNGDCIVTINANNQETTLQRPLLEEGCDVFIKLNEGVSILNKVRGFNEETIDRFLTSQRPFGLATTFSEGTKNKLHDDDVAVYGRKKTITYYPASMISINKQLIDKVKIFLSASYGERIANNLFVIGKPFIGETHSICTETYIAFWGINSIEQAQNAMSYIRTKFFRFLVLLKKPTQHLLKGVYSFVPMQDFSKPWRDEELYVKYGLTPDEIAFIENMIRPMNVEKAEDAEEE